MKSKLTPERQTQVCDYIRMSVSVEVAAGACGIDKTTFYGWLKRGEGNIAEEPYRSFYVEVEKARIEAETILVGVMEESSKKSWRAALWMLERRYPERWGKPGAPADRKLRAVPEP